MGDPMVTQVRWSEIGRLRRSSGATCDTIQMVNKGALSFARFSICIWSGDPITFNQLVTGSIPVRPTTSFTIRNSYFARHLCHFITPSFFIKYGMSLYRQLSIVNPDPASF